MILIYLLCMFASIQAYEISSVDVIVHVSNQHDNYIAESIIQRDDLWRNVTSVLETINLLHDTAVSKAKMLYDPAGAALLAQKMGTNCTVLPSGEYESNYTRIYDTLCCHLRKIRTPALQLLASRAYILFHGGGNEEITSRSGEVVRALEELYILDSRARKMTTCLNDGRLYRSEYSSVRALVSLSVTGKLAHQYSEISLAFTSLQPCLTDPGAACLKNTTLLWEEASVNTDFALYDPTYISACSVAIPAETCIAF